MSRSLLALAAFLVIGSASRAADDDLAVLQPTPGAPPSRQLYKALEAEAKTHFDARRAAVSALKTPEDIARRRQNVRAKLLDALGELPAKTPLNPRVVGTEKRDGYTVERVIYESRPDHHVTALLYLPEGKPPFPGVLVPCGHEAAGKAGESYQRVSILMAKNGLAVLCYDPIGQGERAQLLDKAGKPAFSGSTAEHTAVGIGAMLVGRSVAGYRVWDGIRSLDYLASRPEVDPAKLACTGNSGGGTLTSYLMALDDRVAVAAPSCYITSLERLFATIGPQDGEQNLVGMVANGMEHADFLTARAPKPTLLCVGTRDFFDIQGSWDTFREVKGIYGKLELGERVDLFESDEGHGFTRPRRQATVRWMRRWLLGKDDTAVEPEFPIGEEQKLWCTKSGQVLTEFGGWSVFDMNAERARELAKLREKTPRAGDALLEDVRRVLALRPRSTRPKVVEHGRLSQNKLEMRTLTIEPEPGVTIPILQFARPEVAEAAESPLVLVVGGDRKTLAAPDGFVAREAGEGRRVLVADLRGMGETSPSGSTSRALGAFGADWQEAFLGLHLNRPLIGQRVDDILNVLDAIAPKGEVHLVGIEAAGPVALHAAALDSRISRLTLERSVTSWSAVASVPSTKGELANVIPGVLKTYDFPDLAQALRPRSVQIVDPRDPTDAQPRTHPPPRRRGSPGPLRPVEGRHSIRTSVWRRAMSAQANPYEVLDLETPATVAASKPSPRLDSVDFLRGLVMVVMVLDHTRDYFMTALFDPTDLSQASPALFLTRWVTHFCAPVFAFLAGTGAYLAGRRRTRNELAFFLVTRGFWLIFLEMTVVKFGLLFNLSSNLYLGVVFWSIGWSLIVLAGLIYLPTPVVGGFGIVMIATHNLLDGVPPDAFGRLAPLWQILHQQSLVGTPPGPSFFVVYPLIPWIGVVAAGYAFGPVLLLPPERRQRALLALGLGLTLAFVILRALNTYGDPRPWTLGRDTLYTVLSFINCQKYPPSLLFLLMTLGPAILGLVVYERLPAALCRPCVTLGRVPLFYFVLQWYVIHGLALLVATLRGVPTAWLFSVGGPPSPPPESGFSLPVTYLVWIVVVLILYVPCHWFAGLKQRSRNPLLGYL